MIKDVFASIGAAARKLFTNFGAVSVALLCYAALWLAGWFFVTTREATQLQVALSLIVLPLAVIVFFFMLQTIGLSYVRVGVGAGYLLKRASKDFWKLFVVSLPMFLLAAALWWLFGYLANKFVASVEKPQRWIEMTIMIARWLLLYGLLPLWTIHLWMAAIREGLKSGFRGIFRHLISALAPRSVLIYVIVLAACGALAYYAAFTETHVESEWGELWLFGARFVFALLMIFVGWLLTLGAMAEMTTRRALGEAMSELDAQV